MKVEIEIPEETYDWICSHEHGVTSYFITNRLYSAVKKGKVVPEEDKLKE